MFALSVVLFCLGVTASREIESLCLLFSCFVLLVSLVLIAIRFSSHLNRALLVSPVLSLALGGSEWQPVAVWLLGLLFLEGLRREANCFKAGSYFLVAQILWAAGFGSFWLFTPRSLMVALLLFALSLCLTTALGIWRWQDSVKQTMASLDQDQEM
jgi:hypothetical protein